MIDKLCRALALAALLLSIMALFTPPRRTRQVRHWLAELSVTGWIKSAKVFRILHDEFWSEGNGKDYDERHQMGTGDFYGRQK